jgi:hypothetical protein
MGPVRGTQKSRWVETEIEKGGEVYLLPLRCQVQARGHRLRTTIQTYCFDTRQWLLSHSTAWVSSHKANRLPPHHLDTAAQAVADTLIAGLERGPLHPDWRI